MVFGQKRDFLTLFKKPWAIFRDFAQNPIFCSKKWKKSVKSHRFLVIFYMNRIIVGRFFDISWVVLSVNWRIIDFFWKHFKNRRSKVGCQKRWFYGNMGGNHKKPLFLTFFRDQKSDKKGVKNGSFFAIFCLYPPQLP